jgi:hypothetical protein
MIPFKMVRLLDPCKVASLAQFRAVSLVAVAGLNAAQLFGQGVSYTYDDVIFHPGHINFSAHEVCCILLELLTTCTSDIARFHGEAKTHIIHLTTPCTAMGDVFLLAVCSYIISPKIDVQGAKIMLGSTIQQ